MKKVKANFTETAALGFISQPGIWSIKIRRVKMSEVFYKSEQWNLWQTGCDVTVLNLNSQPSTK